MNKYECTECGQEIESPVPPKRPCKCGARGKWKKVGKAKKAAKLSRAETLAVLDVLTKIQKQLDSIFEFVTFTTNKKDL